MNMFSQTYFIEFLNLIKKEFPLSKLRFMRQIDDIWYPNYKSNLFRFLTSISYNFYMPFNDTVFFFFVIESLYYKVLS